jgi:hypothetical protein
MLHIFFTNLIKLTTWKPKNDNYLGTEGVRLLNYIDTTHIDIFSIANSFK